MRSAGWTLLPLLVPVAVWSRIVRVPLGPLLRVEGTDISISCNVSSYEGPREQNFEWTFSPASAGPPVGVLSTWDPTFTHSSFSQRVDAGAIQLQRLGNSEVVLRVKELRASDGGNYSCSTPSTDATFSGNYEASVWLKVIPDTLRLRGQKGRLTSVRNVTAGASLQLQCQAGMADSSTHTHLSLTWERQSAGSPASEVLSLTHLGRFQPGPEYEQRYETGAVRLETIGSDLYQLTLEGVGEEDAGEYGCVAGTWVLGPSGWEKVQEKRVPVALVDVRPIDLMVSVSEMEVEVPDGGPLSLSCWVSLESDGPAMLQVRWFRSQAGEIQELLGGLNPEPSAEKTITRQLEVPQLWESGEYLCQGTAWTLLRNGTWNRAAQGVSSPVTVRVLSDAPELEVSLNASITPSAADEPTELLCHLSPANDRRLSVSWYFTPSKGSNPTPVLLGSMDQDWTLQMGEGYQERLDRGELSFSRRDPQTFTLRIHWTSDEDRGSYHCTGTAWRQLHNDSWVPASQGTSPPLTLSWATQGESLAVSSRLVKMVAAAGGSFEMMCTVQPQNIPSPQYSVQVLMTPQDPAFPATSVISLNREGVTQRRPSSLSHTFLEKGKEGVYIFKLYQAQNQDAGAYQCAISAWTQGGGGAWRMVRNETTNPVLLQFQNSGPLFNVTAQSDSLSVYRGDRAEFWCIITIDGPAVDPEDMSFDVSWYLQREDGTSVFLAGADRTAQVRHSRRNSSSEVALERVSDMEYRLRVYGCEESDAGGHYCTVTPWVRNGEGSWSQQETITSSPVPISVKMDLLSAFTYPLLMGAGLALVAGLLSCLIGYVSSRFCCKSPPPVQEKRREHRRLMSMELD